jgi:4-amino-4-deoxy-L-arabinose transferase-like glycosyltransferase
MAASGIKHRAFWAAGLALVLAGTFARLAAVAQGASLHMDECLYADTSRHILEHGDLLMNGVWCDKTPLLFWAQALGFAIFGVSDMTARFPGLLAFWIGCAACLCLLPRRYGSLGALASLAVWALSPFAVVFTPMGLTDPPMVALGLVALCYFDLGRSRAAGWAQGLAFAGKTTGLLFWMPLGLLALMREGRCFPRSVGQALKPFLWVLAVLAVHSAFFANPRFGAFIRTLEFAVPPDLPPHLQGPWARVSILAAWAFHLGGNLGANALLGGALLAPGLLWISGKASAKRYALAGACTLSAAAYVALLVFTHGFFYERYLLWLLPSLVLAAPALLAALRRLPGGGGWAKLGLLLLLLSLSLGWRATLRTNRELDYNVFIQNHAIDWARSAKLGYLEGSVSRRWSGWPETGAWVEKRLASQSDVLIFAGPALWEQWIQLFYVHGQRGIKAKNFMKIKDALAAAKDEAGFLIAYKGDFPDLESQMPPLFTSSAGDYRQMVLWRTPLQPRLPVKEGPW